jgi:hypothetical protein
MRVAIVFFAPKNRNKLLEVAKGLAAGIESQGHVVDIVDGDRDVNTKLTIYNYIAVGTCAINTIGGKTSERIRTFLSNAGIIAGKRSFAFVIKGGLRLPKTLSSLMDDMEHEGMYLKYSEILTSHQEAEAIGKRLHID